MEAGFVSVPFSSSWVVQRSLASGCFLYVVKTIVW